MPVKFLLWIFIVGFAYYLLFGVRRNLRPAPSAKARYWVFLIAFVLLLFVLIKLL